MSVVLRSLLAYARTPSGALLSLGIALLAIGGGFAWWPASLLGGLFAGVGAGMRFGHAERRHVALRSELAESQTGLRRLEGELDRLRRESTTRIERLEGEFDRIERLEDSAALHGAAIDEIGERLTTTHDDLARQFSEVVQLMTAELSRLDAELVDQSRALEVVRARRAWTSTSSSQTIRELALSDQMASLERD